MVVLESQRGGLELERGFCFETTREFGRFWGVVFESWLVYNKTADQRSQGGLLEIILVPDFCTGTMMPICQIDMHNISSGRRPQERENLILPFADSRRVRKYNGIRFSSFFSQWLALTQQ